MQCSATTVTVFNFQRVVIILGGFGLSGENNASLKPTVSLFMHLA